MRLSPTSFSKSQKNASVAIGRAMVVAQNFKLNTQRLSLELLDDVDEVKNPSKNSMCLNPDGSDRLTHCVLSNALCNVLINSFSFSDSQMDVLWKGESGYNFLLSESAGLFFDLENRLGVFLLECFSVVHADEIIDRLIKQSENGENLSCVSAGEYSRSLMVWILECFAGDVLNTFLDSGFLDGLLKHVLQDVGGKSTEF